VYNRSTAAAAHAAFDEALSVLIYEVSDEALEAAAGNEVGAPCSCGRCKSGCTQDSR
jgi:hypothetical protein